MICGSITWYGGGTLCKVDGNIPVNAIKYGDILDNHLWPVLACHFANKYYCFQVENAPVHSACIIGEFKRDNGTHSLIWPVQSPDLNIIENLWLRIKRSLQNTAYNINTPWNLLLPLRIYGGTLLCITSRVCMTLFHAGIWQL